MKKLNKRLLLCLLACFMLLPALAACKTGTDSNVPTDTSGEQASTGGEEGPTWETDENGYVKDSIPDKNYGGKQVNVLFWQEMVDTSLPDSAGSKNVVQETVYLRRLRLESRLNINFHISTTPGNWQNRETFLTQARLANEAQYDLISSFSLNPSVLAQEGMLYNLNTLQYPELEMPWWPESTSEWQQYGALYFIASNSSISGINSMETMFSNATLFADRGLEDPVDLALAGNWTVEQMLEMVRAFDVGDDDASRVYGLAVDDHSRMDAFYYGAGFNCVKNNEDGQAELAFVSTTEVDRITSYINRLFTVFQTDAVTIEHDSIALMREHRTALMIGWLGQIQQMEDTDYSPVPLPKLDSDQKNYKTIQSNGFDVWCIPTSAADPELSGLIIEALASADYRTVAPFYFDKYMKLRYASNEICSQMFELIRGSLVYDFGRISQSSLYSVEGAWRACFYDYTLNVKYSNDSFATSVSENKGTAETKLLELLSSYRKYSNQAANAQ